MAAAPTPSTERRSYADPCGARALDAVGERWALLVVRELSLGPRLPARTRRRVRGRPGRRTVRRADLRRRGRGRAGVAPEGAPVLAGSVTEVRAALLGGADPWALRRTGERRAVRRLPTLFRRPGTLSR